VFVDICKDTFCIDHKLIEKKITNKTKAIIVVDLFGNIPDYEKIISIADKYNICVIAEGKETIEVLQKAKEGGCNVDWIEVDAYQGYARSINMGIEANPDSFYFVYMADDVLPGDKWLTNAINFMEDCFPQLDGLVCFNDGKWNGKHASHGLVSRNTWKNLGNSTLFYDGYKHYHPDRELTLVVQAKDRYGYCPSSVLWHNQAKLGLSEVDINTKNAFSTLDKDGELFKQRKADGFPSF
jgi:GT2 family glycosyltransferase